MVAKKKADKKASNKAYRTKNMAYFKKKNAEHNAKNNAKNNAKAKNSGIKKASNAKSNAKHNAKNNAKIQEISRKENEDRLQRLGFTSAENIISEVEAAGYASKMAVEPQDVLGGVSLSDFLKLVHSAGGSIPDPYAFYFGYTGRNLKVEYLRWLSERGQCEFDADGKVKEGGHHGLNKPVLLWGDETVITQKQAENKLGFKGLELYSSTLKLNARRVEAALQMHFQNLSLGVRLWRSPDKGAKYDSEGDQLKVHKVFLTYSPRVAEMLREGIIKVNY